MTLQSFLCFVHFATEVAFESSKRHVLVNADHVASQTLFESKGIVTFCTSKVFGSV